MTFNLEDFQIKLIDSINQAKENNSIQDAALKFIIESDKLNYGYFWNWMGLPLIQMPEDIVLTQEIILNEKPDYIIELGVAWGGQTLMCSTLLNIIKGQFVIGIDRVIPEHNRKRILSQTNSSNIVLIEGDSTDESIYNMVMNLMIKKEKRVLLILDSNHTHDHVLQELKLWSKLLRKNDLIIVSDTVVEEIPKQTHRVREWGPANNPATALMSFLKDNCRFEKYVKYSDRAIASYNRGGYVICNEDSD